MWLVTRLTNTKLHLTSMKTAAKTATRRFASHSMNDIGKTLELETIDVNLFRCKSPWRPPGARSVYGGHVVGQALTASHMSLSNQAFDLNSMHSYFVRAGDPDVPILYQVKILSSSNNFETHVIEARQRGQAIFSCQSSFHRPEESPLNHQRPMPDAPPPESLLNQKQLLHKLLSDPRTPPAFLPSIKDSIEFPFPIDVRPVDPVDYFDPRKVDPPRKLLWMKAPNIPGPLNLHVHRCIAAFSSDWGIGTASLLPYGIPYPSAKLRFVASLDHNMWFHTHEFRTDEWLLYEFSSVRGLGGRGMNFGHVYTQKGELVITCVQESIIRFQSKKKKKDNTAPPA